MHRCTRRRSASGRQPVHRKRLAFAPYNSSSMRHSEAWHGEEGQPMRENNQQETSRAFNAAEIGALAHLYRGEFYRSTI